MPEVLVEINDRKYRMACEEGQEVHLMNLAKRFNEKVDQFKDGFGEVGDTRLTVMAGIAVLDELMEAERRIAALQQDISELTEAGNALSGEYDALERKFAKRLNEAARKIEAVATAIDDTGSAGNHSG